MYTQAHPLSGRPPDPRRDIGSPHGPILAPESVTTGTLSSPIRDEPCDFYERSLDSVPHNHIIGNRHSLFKRPLEMTIIAKKNEPASALSADIPKHCTYGCAPAHKHHYTVSSPAIRSPTGQ